MNKIKVIDLLNMISKGEEVPGKISYNGNDYKLVEYGETTKLYQCLSEPYELFNIKTDRLNDTVEIIEDTPKEDKKIEKLSDELTYIKLVDNETFRKNVLKKINEIIDKVNGE